MQRERARVLLSWSSGKDCAWALHVLRQRPDLEVVGLLTTFNEAFDRVAMHAVRRELVELQAAAAGLPLIPVMLPFPCTNEIYEERMKAAIAEAKAGGVTHIAFGDLFLEDVRQYRVRLLEGTGIEPMFPLWGTPDDTPKLARQMVASGLEAVLTCVDPKQLGRTVRGAAVRLGTSRGPPGGCGPVRRTWGVPHVLFQSPGFRSNIPIHLGERIQRDGFWFCDLLHEA